MRLKHYTRSDTFEYSPDREYEQGKRMDKPNGLWVSVEGPDDWREWCTNEGFCAYALENEYDVVLAPSANILYVETVEELLGLSARFPRVNNDVSYFDDHPDWEQVVQVYDGIIIAPYQWSCRLDVGWYYTWDCASGVIWNLDAIESITPVMAELILEGR